MVKRIFARLLKADGKYHYGLWSTVAREAGPLFEISVEGEGELPPNPHGSATPEEHEHWISGIRKLGFAVKVTEVLEPDSAGL